MEKTRLTDTTKAMLHCKLNPLRQLLFINHPHID
jgi:hypothetical protein